MIFEMLFIFWWLLAGLVFYCGSFITKEKKYIFGRENGGSGGHN
jgi:hypothetical protein